MEVLLQKTIERRSMHIEHVMEKDDARVRGLTKREVLNSLHFSHADMTTVMNAWRYDHQSWMKEETQNELWFFNKHKDWHGLEKRAFSAYLHQISGNKFLLHELIELPLIILNRGGPSEEEPSTGGREQIRGLCAKTTPARLIQKWKEHKKSDEYKESRKKGTNKGRSSKETAYFASRNPEKASGGRTTGARARGRTYGVGVARVLSTGHGQ